MWPVVVDVKVVVVEVVDEEEEVVAMFQVFALLTCDTNAKWNVSLVSTRSMSMSSSGFVANRNDRRGRFYLFASSSVAQDDGRKSDSWKATATETSPGVRQFDWQSITWSTTSRIV